MPIFKDRRDAGRQLAQELTSYADRHDVVILALPRGGVPVAFEVAQTLNAPLDIFLVRKLGVPGHEELAFGAIAPGGVRVLNKEVVRGFNLSEDEIDQVARRELLELERREQAYRGEDRSLSEINNRTVILVDDGLATGASMRAAIEGVRARNPERIVVAVPTAAPETCKIFEALVDEIICAVTPQPFYGVGRWYQDFSQTTDEEVRMFLEQISKELNSVNHESGRESPKIGVRAYARTPIFGLPFVNL